MDFNVFIENIVDLLKKRMGKTYDIRVTTVTKNNDVRITGVIMMARGDTISPTIYLEGFYEQYQEGAAMERLVDEIISIYEDQMRDINLDMEFFQDFEKVRDRIFYKLISFEKNVRLLEDVPHFRWYDLAIVFYYAMEEELVGKASITIHNQHMTMWSQSVDSLYRTAQKNMKEGMPELLLTMSELFRQMTGVRIQKDDEIPMYVLTNQEKIYGAAALLYSEQLKDLADRIGYDLLILPSSVHEVLLVPDDHRKGYDFYIRMVDEVNRTQVEPEEVLSYKLYRYNRKRAEIEEIFS